MISILISTKYYSQEINCMYENGAYFQFNIGKLCWNKDVEFHNF